VVLQSCNEKCRMDEVRCADHAPINYLHRLFSWELYAGYAALVIPGEQRYKKAYFFISLPVIYFPKY